MNDDETNPVDNPGTLGAVAMFCIFGFSAFWAVVFAVWQPS